MQELAPELSCIHARTPRPSSRPSASPATSSSRPVQPLSSLPPFPSSNSSLSHHPFSVPSQVCHGHPAGAPRPSFSAWSVVTSSRAPDQAGLRRPCPFPVGPRRQGPVTPPARQARRLAATAGQRHRDQEELSAPTCSSLASDVSPTNLCWSTRPSRLDPASSAREPRFFASVLNHAGHQSCCRLLPHRSSLLPALLPLLVPSRSSFAAG